MKNRRLRYGALAAAITLLGILLVLAANLLVDRLSDRYGWQADLTEDGRYALSAEAEEALKGLAADVSLTVMNPEEELKEGSTYVMQVYQLLQQMQRMTGRLSVKYVDLVENPTWRSRYPDLPIASWTILAESGDRQELVTFAELYDYSEDGSTITTSRVEQKLVNAVLSVVSREKPLVTVLTGYGDGAPEDLSALLTGGRFEVETRSLLTEEMNPEAEFAILYAPSGDLEAASLKKLDVWLENGGEQGKNLFVFLDPNTPDLPKLAEFLGGWGLALGEGLAFEGNTSLYYERPYYPIAQYGDMTYAEGMTSSDLVIMALCRPVSVLYESRDNTETAVLLQFTGTSGSVALGADAIRAEDVTGNVQAMVMGTHSWYGSEVTRSRVVVSGSALAFSGSLVTSQTFANGKYILNLFQKLTAEESAGVNIPAKELTQPVHSFTTGQVNSMIWAFLVILPAGIAVLGMLVWLRRRNR